MNVNGVALEGSKPYTQNMLSDNHFFINGCLNPKYVGNKMNHELYIKNWWTPDAKRDTGKIEISLWRDFDYS